MRDVYRHQNSYHNFEHAVACPSCRTCLALFVTRSCHLSLPLASFLVPRTFRHLSLAASCRTRLGSMPPTVAARRHPPVVPYRLAVSFHVSAAFHCLSPTLASRARRLLSLTPFWSMYFRPFSRLLLKPGRPRALFRRSDPHERYRRHELDCPAVPISGRVSVAPRS
jgi:hypothetical protein